MVPSHLSGFSFFMNTVFFVLDDFLIAPFRLFLSSTFGFWFGCSVLALYCIVLGEFCFFVVYIVNRKFYVDLNQGMTDMHNISVEAIRRKNKQIFKDANWWANEYFGKVFFSQMALFAVSILPVPFAMGWLQWRFSGIAVHSFAGIDFGYGFVFLSVYIVLRIGFSKIRRKIPILKKLDEMRQADGEKAGKITSWTELDKKSTD